MERKIITDKLVVEKTGATMEEWFRQLDKAGAKKLSHVEIFTLISNTRGLQPLGEWNQNLLTTSYEWDRGLKKRGEKKNGFEISVSKTVTVAVELLFNGWANDVIRKKWLQEQIVFRKTTLNRSARITWSDNTTSLSVDFYSKGGNKSQVVVQHLKLQGPGKAAEMRSFWAKELELLQSILQA